MEFNYDKNRIWLANEDGDAIAFVDFPEFEPGCILRRRAATGAFASGHPALPAAGVNRPLYVQS